MLAQVWCLPCSSMAQLGPLLGIVDVVWVLERVLVAAG